MKSPITGSKNISLEREIFSSFVIDGYKRELGINVSKFFRSIEKIGLYRCLDSSYRFYYPFTATGDDEFYQRLEKFPWYYMDWKWEHATASVLVKPGDKVLEIGCAHGTFLKKIKEKGASTEGLEMNKNALDDCIANGLQVFSDSIEIFSLKYPNTYDIVCSFQVLEHVADVKSFIEASLAVLKPGGLLIIAVPNNDNFVLNSGTVLLDMPPHHMGLWTMNSLIKLQEYFKIKVESLLLEPLQQYHVGDAEKIAYKKLAQKLKSKFGPFSKILYPLGKPFVRAGVNAIKDFVIGHTIMAVYKKTDEKQN